MTGLRRAFVVALWLAAACGPTEMDRRRAERRAQKDTAAPIDTTFRGSVHDAADVPVTWDTVVNPSGVTFRQPHGFTFGLDAVRLHKCDATTPPADSAIFDKTFLERWPLTLAIRRGDVNRIARANGFTLDSTDVATHEGRDSTTVRSGKGWVVLSGETVKGISVLFAAKRLPGDCYLIWAARGAALNPDTLGMVLSTVQYTQ